MEHWTAHHLIENATQIHSEIIVKSLFDYSENLRNNNIPIIFNLNHFSKINHVSVKYLISSINRHMEHINYHLFSVRKRSGGKRYIHAPTKRIRSIQTFINKYILSNICPHPRSFAYSKLGGIVRCAEQHLGARWLFQFDLKDFFYSISEYSVYKIFRDIGYTKKLSFEFARLCTTTLLPPHLYKKYIINSQLDCTADNDFRQGNRLYASPVVGVLPQGAPSSPMLSNLAAYSLDNILHSYATEHQMVYTRYADDITFSAYSIPKSMTISSIINDIKFLIRNENFQENKDKIHVARPGSRKLVLGLLVDGNKLRVSKEMFKRISRKIYAINKFGLLSVANNDGFNSAFGLYNHVQGLLAYLKDVDHAHWEYLYPKFEEIEKKWKIQL